MQNREIAALYDNVTLIVPVPTTYAEAEDIIGEAGGLLSGWLADTIARNYLPRVYNAASKEIETSFPCLVVKTEGEGDKKKDVYETSIKHCGRYWETLDDDGKKAFAARVQEIALTLPIWAKGDRSQSGAIPDWASEAANAQLANGNAEAVAEKIEATQPGAKVLRDADGQVTVDGLARAIAGFAKWKAEQAKKDAVGDLLSV